MPGQTLISPPPSAARLHISASLALLMLGALGAATLAGCGNGSSLTAAPAVEELRAAGFAEYLGRQTPSRIEQSGAWTIYHFDPAEEGAICLSGAPYQVGTRRGRSNQTLVFLQGGGACWDHLSCYVLGTAVTQAGGPPDIGILDLDQPGNPFADWNVVYAPYCDGSVFIGDRTVDYGGRRTFHHGLRNLSVATDAALRDFPDSERVVVSGSSAGGYGTFAGYGVFRSAFPETPILIFNDSGPGLQNVASSADIQNRTVNWNFNRLIPPSCTECTSTQQYTFLLPWAFERDPWLRVAMYSYQQDGTISFFIDLSGPEYQDLLLDVTGQVQARYPERLARYFPEGSTHTVLMSPEFHTQTVNGVGLRDWTQAFIDDTSPWVDVIE